MLLLSCESKETRAYKLAMHSNDISELQEFLEDYSDDASADEINDVRDKIEELQADAADFKEIKNTQDLSLRVDLEKKYLQRYKPIHEQEVKEMHNKDKVAMKNQEEAMKEAQKKQRESQENSFGKAIRNKIGNYLVKRELNKYFRNYSFHNSNQNGEFNLVFSNIGDNGTGIGYVYQQGQNPTQFTYALIEKGKIGVTFPNGRLVFQIYNNGLVTNGFLYEKVYNPQAYRYFFR